MSSSPAVSLCANLESLADHTCTAVPTADGALRALVGHVLLQVACQHSLVAQITLDLLEFTCLQVGLGEGKGWGHVLASEGCVQGRAHINVLQQSIPATALVCVVTQHLHLGDLLATGNVWVELQAGRGGGDAASQSGWC